MARKRVVLTGAGGYVAQRMIETESIEDENGVPFPVIYGTSGNTHRFWSLTNASRRAAARPVTPVPTTTQSGGLLAL